MKCPNCGEVIDKLLTYGGIIDKPGQVRDRDDWFYCPYCVYKNKAPRGCYMVTGDPDEARIILNEFVREVEKVSKER